MPRRTTINGQVHIRRSAARIHHSGVRRPATGSLLRTVTIHLPLLYNPTRFGVRLPIGFWKLRRTLREMQARFSGFTLSLVLGWCREDGVWDPAFRIEFDAEYSSRLVTELDLWKQRLQSRFVQRSIYMRVLTCPRFLIH
jgi:hypothetical protein